MEKNILLGLQSKDYEHPFDKAALAKMKKLSGFETATTFFLDYTSVKWQIIQLQGSHFHITEDSCPELYHRMIQVLQTLDVHSPLKLYTRWNYDINGYTTGLNDTTIMVLNSGTVDLLTPEEQLYVIGHEAGHIKSGHILYHTMADLFNDVMDIIPLGSTLTMPIYYALKYWQRMSEFTADRAGLLACQDLDVAIDAIIKTAGIPKKFFGHNNREAFIQQAHEFSNSFDGFTDNMIKFASIASSSHPWTVLRAAELLKWVETGEYQQVIDRYQVKNCCNPLCGEKIASSAEICPYCGSKQS